MAPQPTPHPAARRRNTRTAVSLLAVVVGMVGLAFASVPLYRLFCEATGFNGTTQRASAAPKEIAKGLITVRFDAQTAPDLAWTFEPQIREVQVHPGEQREVFYHAVNRSHEPITGTATYNVTPAKAGIYFDKLQCFCFSEQHLAPGEGRDMGVSFFVDPDMLKDADTRDVKTITLSYSMFRKPEQSVPSAAVTPAGPAKTVN